MGKNTKKNRLKKRGKKRGGNENGLTFCSETEGDLTKCVIRKGGRFGRVLAEGFGIDYETARIAAIEYLKSQD